MGAQNYYTVYNAKTDDVVASGTEVECAKAMHRSLASFYCTVSRNRSGKHHKYSIVIDSIEEDGYYSDDSP